MVLEHLGDDNKAYRVVALDVTKREVLRDLQRAPDVEQSALYKKLFSQALGTFGGEPTKCVLCDFDLTSAPEDAELAGRLAVLGAATNVPIICGVEATGSIIADWSREASQSFDYVIRFMKRPVIDHRELRIKIASVVLRFGSAVFESV
jgi:type VI secretion system protein ImpC